MGSIIVGLVLMANIAIIGVWTLDRTGGKTEETLAERYKSVWKALW